MLVAVLCVECGEAAVRLLDRLAGYQPLLTA